MQTKSLNVEAGPEGSKRLGRQPWALSLPDKELCLREALAVLRGTLGSSLRSPAEREGHEGFPPPPEKALGSPIFPSGCEGKLGVALESLQGLRDLT